MNKQSVISVKSHVPEALKLSSKKFEQNLLKHLNTVDYKLPIGVNRVAFPLRVLSLRDPFSPKVVAISNI